MALVRFVLFVFVIAAFAASLLSIYFYKREYLFKIFKAKEEHKHKLCDDYANKEIERIKKGEDNNENKKKL